MSQAGVGWGDGVVAPEVCDVFVEEQPCEELSLGVEFVPLYPGNGEGHD